MRQITPSTPSTPSIVKKNLSSWLFVILLILSLLSSVLASPILVARQNNPDGTVVVQNSASGGDYQLTVHAIILAIILFIFGLVFLFFGFRHFRLTSFLVGFYVFANITWIILANAEPQATYGPNRLTIFLVVSLIIGILAGLFFACCFHLGIWLLGAFGGYVIGLWILAWRSGGTIQQYWGQGLFLGLMALAGLLFAIFFELTAVIIFTSFIGAYSIILGLDIFLNTGFSMSILYILIAKHDPIYQTNPRIFGMLAGLLALAILGMIVQFFLSRRYKRQAWNTRYGYAGTYRGANATQPAVVQPMRTKRWGLF